MHTRMHAHTHTHTHTHTQTYILWLSGFCLGQPGWAGTRRNIHPLTPIMVISHPLSVSSIYYDPWHPPCSIYVPDSLLAQCTNSIQVFFGLPHVLAPSTSYSIHFFTQSLSSFCSTCPYHCNLLSCSSEIMSSNPSLSLNPLLGTVSCSLTPHINLTILISARWRDTSFSFVMGQVSLPCNILLCTQLQYNVPLTINDTSLLWRFAFSAMMPLVGQQEGHPACKKLSGGVLAWLWWGTGMVICLRQGADLHMAHLWHLNHKPHAFSNLCVNTP